MLTKIVVGQQVKQQLNCFHPMIDLKNKFEKPKLKKL